MLLLKVNRKNCWANNSWRQSKDVIKAKSENKQLTALHRTNR